MTAEDVAFSLNRNLQPELGGYFAPFWGNVGSVAATGASEVTITLERPDVLFWKTLSMASGAVSRRRMSSGRARRTAHPRAA